MSIETGPIVEIGINPTGVEEISSTITEDIGPTIGIEVDQGIMGMEITTRETIIPKTIEGIIIDRTMAIKGIQIETEVKVRIAVGQGRGIGVILERTSEIGHMIEVKAEIEKEKAKIGKERV